MENVKPRLYLAGGLFNAAERMHILNLECCLIELGYEVIVPMREALKRFNSGTGKFDLNGISQDCCNGVSDKNTLFVGCLDGPDADSGTAVEYGIAIALVGKAIVYRTDFRTALDREVGVNGMFNLSGTKMIYEPCFATNAQEAGLFYKKLASRIDLAIKEWIS